MLGDEATAREEERHRIEGESRGDAERRPPVRALGEQSRYIPESSVLPKLLEFPGGPNPSFRLNITEHEVGLLPL